MSKIRVLAIPPDAHGVGKFRVLNPFVHLQEIHGNDFHVDISMKVPDDDKSFDGYDIVVFHTSIHHGLPYQNTINRIGWLKKKGIVTVMDMDDYWKLDMRHPMYSQMQNSDVVKMRINAIRESDYITVTTPIFKKTVQSKFRDKKVYVFPNAIDVSEGQYIPKPIPSNRLRFGWLGGSSHLHDLDLMRVGISKLLVDYRNQVQIVLCGFDLRGNMTIIDKKTGEKTVRPIEPEESVWYKYEQIFTDNYQSVSLPYRNYLKMFINQPFNTSNEPYVRRWTMPINTYATNYNFFDVSLAPLVPNIFNANKSQLKVIESGFHKKALIASETDPYTIDLVSAVDKGGGFNSKGNSLLVSSSKDHKQWYQHMKRLIENPSLVVDLGNKLYESVKDKYNLTKVTSDRAEFIKTIINKQNN